VKSFLLKHGRRYPTTTAARWSGAFEEWARTQNFDEPTAQAAFLYLLAAEQTRSAQLTAIEAGLLPVELRKAHSRGALGASLRQTKSKTPMPITDYAGGPKTDRHPGVLADRHQRFQ
jgi:hypothetical protein